MVDVAAAWMRDDAEELSRKSTSRLLQRSRMTLRVLETMVVDEDQDDGDEATVVALNGESLRCHLLMERPAGEEDRQFSVDYFRSLQLKIQLYHTGPRGLPIQIKSGIVDSHVQCIHGDALRSFLPEHGNDACDVMFSIKLQCKIESEYAHKKLTLAVIVSPPAPLHPALQYDLFSSPVRIRPESRYSIAEDPLSPLSSSTSPSPSPSSTTPNKVGWQRSREDLLTSLLLNAEREAGISQTPLRQVSRQLRLIEPLSVTSHAFFTGNVSFISINVANAHTTLSLRLRDVRFHLSSTRWRHSDESATRKQIESLLKSQDVIGTEDEETENPYYTPAADRDWYNPTSIRTTITNTSSTKSTQLKSRDGITVDSINRAFQAVMPFHQSLPLKLGPQEHQHFIVRVEPITGKSLAGRSGRRRIGDARADLIFGNSLTGKFESMISVAWGVVRKNHSKVEHEDDIACILTRKSAWWSRPDALSDDIAIEIDSPTIARHERVFVARVCIQNNSSKPQDLTLVVDPMYCATRTKVYKDSYQTFPQSPSTLSRRSSPSLTPLNCRSLSPPEGMRADTVSKGNSYNGDKTSSGGLATDFQDYDEGKTTTSVIPDSVPSMASIFQTAQNRVDQTRPAQQSQSLSSPSRCYPDRDTRNLREYTGVRGRNRRVALLCLQSSVQIGQLAPGKKEHVTLHFLPMKCGVVKLDTFKIIDSITGKCFRLRKSFVITVVGASLALDSEVNHA